MVHNALLLPSRKDGSGQEGGMTQHGNVWMDASTVCGRWHSATMGNIHVQIQARRGLRRPGARIALGNGKHRRASGGRLSRQGMLRTCLACTSGRPCAVCVHNRFMVLKRYVPCPPHTDSLIPARHLRRRTLLALCAVGRLRLRRNGVSVVRALCVPAIAPLAFAPSGRGEAPCMGRGHSDQPHSPASQGQGQASFQLDGCCDLLLAHP